MKFQYNFTTGGQAGNFTKFASLNYTESYTTAYVSSTTYKVNLVSVWGGENTTTTSWILKNGTVIAIYENGQNVTGLQLQQAAIALDGIFPAQIPADSPLSAFVTSLGIGMQPNGNSTATFGSNTFTVANYAPKTLPVQIVVGCGVSGSPLTAALTAFQMSVGEPKGTSIDLVTSSEIAISYSFAASVLMDSVATQLISFTVR